MTDIMKASVAAERSVVAKLESDETLEYWTKRFNETQLLNLMTRMVEFNTVLPERFIQLLRDNGYEVTQRGGTKLESYADHQGQAFKEVGCTITTITW